jgi:hypothetical protein
MAFDILGILRRVPSFWAGEQVLSPVAEQVAGFALSLRNPFDMLYYVIANAVQSTTSL